jgi:hypothetical protein
MLAYSIHAGSLRTHADAKRRALGGVKSRDILVQYVERLKTARLPITIAYSHLQQKRHE